MVFKIPIDIIAIDSEGFHLFINAKVNGKPARLLIDTGASKTVFDKKRIRGFIKKAKLEKIDKLSTGLGTNTMKSHSTILDSIRIKQLTIKKYKTVLLDLSHVNNSYKMMKLKPLDGVMGSDLLAEYGAVIDYAKKELRLKMK